MEKRKRFRRSRICSGTNYEISKELGRQYLTEKHESRIEEIQVISSQIEVKKTSYVRCFDRLIPVSQEEIKVLGETVKIIYKQASFHSYKKLK